MFQKISKEVITKSLNAKSERKLSHKIVIWRSIWMNMRMEKIINVTVVVKLFTLNGD